MELIEVTSIDESDLPWGILKKESLKSPMKFKISCLITDKKGRKLSIGFNSLKTHPLGAKEYKTMHGEISAIYNCIKKGVNLENSIAYIYRMNGLMSKPCNHCYMILKKFGVKKVYYTNKL